MLKLATEQDIDQIVKIFSGAKRRMNAEGLEQWADEEGYPNREIVELDVLNKISYVYVVDDMVAGVITINDDFYEAYPIKPNRLTSRALHRVAVSDDFLGQGIGTKLYLEAEKVIKAAGYQTVIVDTYSRNIKMNNLIKKCGYSAVGEFKLFDELPNWIMYSKQLVENE